MPIKTIIFVVGVKSHRVGNHCRMDALFSKNVEDKEVFFKKMENVEGVVEGRLESAVGNRADINADNAAKGEGKI